MPNTQKFCAVCGMPLNGPEDYPEGANMNKVDWCKWCGDKDSMKSYDEALIGMTHFIMNSQSLPEEQAHKAAEEVLANSEAMKSGRMKK